MPALMPAESARTLSLAVPIVSAPPLPDRITSTEAGGDLVGPVRSGGAPYRLRPRRRRDQAAHVERAGEHGRRPAPAQLDGRADVGGRWTSQRAVTGHRVLAVADGDDVGAGATGDVCDDGVGRGLEGRCGRRW